MTSILTIKDLSVRFGGVLALSNVNCKVHSGEIHGLIGPNGAGKSTLFNAVSGLVRPAGGRITFMSRDITGIPPHEVADAGIARTFQNLKLFEEMTVMENVITGALCGYGTRFWGSLFCGRKTRIEDREVEEKAASILESLGLIAIKDKFVNGLPYGQKKGVELARSLATDPKILLLDEPKAGMNIEESETIMSMLATIREAGLTIFLVEHDMRMVMDLSDRITVLHFGMKIAEGTPDEIANDKTVIDAYLGRKSDIIGSRA